MRDVGFKKRITFLEIAPVFSNQVKLPYSTGVIWSHCLTNKVIKNNYELYTLLNLDGSDLKIDEIQYLKKKNIPSKLEILLNKSINGFNLQKISFKENKNYISIDNLYISDDFK